MKGPEGRIQQDVRRLWKCPECGTQIKMAGNVVQKICRCQKEGHQMKLVSEPTQSRVMSSIQKMKEVKIPESISDFSSEADQQPAES